MKFREMLMWAHYKIDDNRDDQEHDCTHHKEQRQPGIVSFNWGGFRRPLGGRARRRLAEGEGGRFGEHLGILARGLRLIWAHGWGKVWRGHRRRGGRARRSE